MACSLIQTINKETDHNVFNVHYVLTCAFNLFHESLKKFYHRDKTGLDPQLGVVSYVHNHKIVFMVLYSSQQGEY